MYVESRKTVQMNLMKGRNRDVDGGKEHVDTGGEGWGGMNWEI